PIRHPRTPRPLGAPGRARAGADVAVGSEGGYCPAMLRANKVTTDVASRPLRIGVLAPPWISIPPHDCGGIEEVVRLLCQGLVSRGHDVTLFAAPGSESDARLVEVL